MKKKSTSSPKAAESTITIEYLLTEKDDKTGFDLYIDSLFEKISGVKKISRVISLVFLVFIIGATVRLILIDGIAKHLVLLIGILILTAVVLGWKYINRFLMRLFTGGTKYNSEKLNILTEAAFFKNRLTFTNQTIQITVPWDEITLASVNAEGLLLINQPYGYFFLPARFFDEKSAEAVNRLLQKKLGDRFKEKKPMKLLENNSNM